MGVVESGSIRRLITSIRGPRGNADGLLNQLVAGDHYATLKAGSSPFQYLPDSEAAKRHTMRYRWLTGAEMVAGHGTTDGTTSEIFATLTNSGTFTATSTQAGYQGEGVSTTGNSSGNQNAFIGTPGFLSVANQLGIMYGRFYFPDPNVNAYSFVFGFGNKQADPIGTPFTDGGWIQGATSGGAIAFVGKTRENTGTASTSATLGTIASGAARSVELAVVLHGQSNVDFWTRDPSTATNLWVRLNYASTEIPRSTIVMRPHFVHYTNAAATNAVQIGELAYWWLRPTTF